MESGYKKQLYADIIRMKKFLGYMPRQYGIDIVSNWPYGIRMDTVPFKTKGLRGMAIVGEAPDPDIILLNAARTIMEQNFDCVHEMVHLFKHRKLDKKTFNCFDKVAATQDPFLEWQANEGAAEFLVPYSIFIPLAKEFLDFSFTKINIDAFKTYASNIFKVPPAVIKYRLDSLKYEMYQYYAGIDIKNIKILSMHQQAKLNIAVISFNDIAPGESFDVFEYIEKKNRSYANRNGFQIDFLLSDCSERYN